MGEFVVQNSLVTPVALAVNQGAPSITDQLWQIVFTGVLIIDFYGNNPHDWRRETILIVHDMQSPYNTIVTRYGFPKPPANSVAFQVDQAALFVAPSSVYGRDHIGFAVNQWRIKLYQDMVPGGGVVDGLFAGIEVDLAVRNHHAKFSQVSYHITMTGKLVTLEISG